MEQEIVFDTSEIVTTRIGRNTWAAMWTPCDTVTYRMYVGKSRTKEGAVADLLQRSRAWVESQKTS